MNPLVILTCVFAAACAAPAADPSYVTPVAAAGYAAAPGHVAVADQYLGSTRHVAGAPVTHIEQAPDVVSKQVHLGKTQFVSGYSAGVIKPAIPDFNIAVPNILKGSVAVNAPIVKNVKEIHSVNEPVPVERRVEVPYDVPVPREVIEEVAVPYHVDKPYAVPHPVPVAGEPIVNVRQGQPIVQRTHTAVAAHPVSYGIAAQPLSYAGYAAQPAGYAHAGQY